MRRFNLTELLLNYWEEFDSPPDEGPREGYASYMFCLGAQVARLDSKRREHGVPSVYA